MNPTFNRRVALIGLAAGAGALATGNLARAQGGPYKESPLLAELVKAGKLPPVDQRLPEKPLVVPVVEKVGEYGGVWRRAFLGPADANNYIRIVYDALFRFSPDGAKIEHLAGCGNGWAYVSAGAKLYYTNQSISDLRTNGQTPDGARIDALKCSGDGWAYVTAGAKLYYTNENTTDLRPTGQTP